MGDTTADPPIVLPGPTEAVEVEVTTIVTVGVRIAKTMDAIGTDETVTAAIITAIIGIMPGVMMTIVAAAGMTAGVIKIVATEMETVAVDIRDMTTT